MNTLFVPNIGVDDSLNETGRNPALVWKAGKQPLRVLVRNISPMGRNVFLTYAITTLAPGQTSPANSFTLPPGVSEVFTLLPDESLYASTTGMDPGQISIAVSVAFPFEIKPV
jgi:hypothetical protein